MKFGKLVDRLYQIKHLSLSQADNAKCQYNDLLHSVCVIHPEEFSGFDYKSELTSWILGQFIEKGQRFSDPWTVCIFVWVLTDSQSQTERGFNINKATLVENLEETLVKGQRLFYGCMASKNVTIHEFIIPKELTLACKSAYN